MTSGNTSAGGWSVELPEADPSSGEAFILRRDGASEKVVLHDYARIYSVPGLYEHVVQHLLHCRSPAVASRAIGQAAEKLGLVPSELRVLDLGAGNGILGELLLTEGVTHVVGVDNLPEAREACFRDRAGVYEAYFVTDLANAPYAILSELAGRRFACLSCVGALGGGHISPEGLVRAINLLNGDALVVLTIHEKWLRPADAGGFAGTLRSIVAGGYLAIEKTERFVHRLDTSGAEIMYFLVVARRVGHIPLKLARRE